MRYLQVRGVVGCHGKQFEGFVVRHYAGVDIGDTSWCHSLPEGDVNISSHPCTRRRLSEKIWQAANDPHTKFLSRREM
jgi:hypothetical protein